MCKKGLDLSDLRRQIRLSTEDNSHTLLCHLMKKDCSAIKNNCYNHEIKKDVSDVFQKNTIL